jgi:hypothetical protein
MLSQTPMLSPNAFQWTPMLSNHLYLWPSQQGHFLFFQELAEQVIRAFQGQNLSRITLNLLNDLGYALVDNTPFQQYVND